MPNWCYTDYVIEGNKPKDIETLKARLDELKDMKKPLLPNGFGNLWLGNIVHLLGGNWEEVYCRGKILDYSLGDDGNLHLTVESAWCEMKEVRDLFLRRHPEYDIFYSSEEGGMGIYITNDRFHKYFKQRYVLDTEDDGWKEYESFPDIAGRIQELTGIECFTEDELYKAIDTWTEKNPEKNWASLNKFDIVND